MPIRAASGSIPDWDGLFRVAEAQAGYFTTRDAAAHGIGTALLAHHLRTARVQRAVRGVFRLARYPTSDREELVPYWLWSNRAGVFSHETALSLYGLSDLAPTHVDMTLPLSWSRRRLKHAPSLVLHFGEIPSSDQTSWGPLPMTTLVRTLNDCAQAGTERQFLSQAIGEAQRRGMLLKGDLKALHPELRSLARSKLEPRPRS